MVYLDHTRCILRTSGKKCAAEMMFSRCLRMRIRHHCQSDGIRLILSAHLGSRRDSRRNVMIEMISSVVVVVSVCYFADTSFPMAGLSSFTI